MQQKCRLTGADPGSSKGGGALVYRSTSTPINHVFFFFWQNTSCSRKTAGHISGGEGGGVRPPGTHPQEPPQVKMVSLNGFNPQFYVFMTPLTFLIHSS